MTAPGVIGDDDDDDEGTFEFYKVSTKDHGPVLLIGTILFSMALYALLPLLVKCSKRREERRDAKRRLDKALHDTDEEEDMIDDSVSVQKDGEIEISFNDVVPPRPSPSAPSVRSYSTRKSNNIHTDGWDVRSKASQATRGALSTNFIHEVLANTHQAGQRGLHKNRIQRRHYELRADDPESKEFDALYKRAGIRSTFSDNGRGRGGGGGGPRSVASYSPQLDKRQSLQMQCPPSPSRTFTPGMNLGACSYSPGVGQASPVPSLAGGGPALAVSDLGSEIGSTAYLDPYRNSTKSIATESVVEDEGKDGEDNDEEKVSLSLSAKSKSSSSGKNWWDKLLQVVEWDHENKRLFKLAIPYTGQALVAGIAEAARVAVVGKFYGTRELAAYVVVNMFFSLIFEFFGGIIDSMALMVISCVGKVTLSGQYIQIGLVLYMAIVTPITMVCVLFMADILAFFGFDAETVRIGAEFTHVYAWYLVVSGFDESLNALLDITNHEVYSTVVTCLREIAITVAILVAALIAQPSLQDAAFLMLAIALILLLWNIGYIAGRGWWKKYYHGMLYSFALRNWEATKSIIATAIPLSFGYLLAYGEWELLTVFAKFLGPAEVAAWGLLGTVWDVLEDTTEAISEAGEVRCAFLLGAGRPADAKLSAYKSVFLAFFSSIIMSSIVLMCGEAIAVWMTDDPTLQRLVAELIPLFAMGNVALTTGTTAWTLVGAQGRYSLSTAVGFAGSWGVTVPLAALSSVALGFDLRGQTAAVVAGYMVSGTCNLFFLLRSDWKGISKRVIAYNVANNIDLDSDQASASSCDDESSRDSREQSKSKK